MKLDKKNTKIYISYFKHHLVKSREKYEEIFNKVKNICEEKKFTVIDKHSNNDNELESNKLDNLTNKDFVIFLINDQFLKSIHCMLDWLKVSELFEHKNIVPIVLRSSNFYDILTFANYLRYWDDKIEEENDEEKKEQLMKIRLSLLKIRTIFFDVAIKYETHKNEDFSSAFEYIEKQILENVDIEKDFLFKNEIKEKLEKERLEKEKLENERLENERLENERLENERLENERLENERLENERLENEKLENEKLENERLEKEKLENERLEKEKLEKEKLEKEKLEKEKLEKEKLEKEEPNENEDFWDQAEKEFKELEKDYKIPEEKEKENEKIHNKKDKDIKSKPKWRVRKKEEKKKKKNFIYYALAVILIIIIFLSYNFYQNQQSEINYKMFVGDGDVMQEQGKFEDAIKKYDEALLLKSDGKEAISGKEESLKAIEKEKKRGEFEILIKIAEEFINEGEFSYYLAKENYRKARDLDFDNKLVYEKLDIINEKIEAAYLKYKNIGDKFANSDGRGKRVAQKYYKLAKKIKPNKK